MVNFLPAILIGGSPNAGKSVLFYRLTQALRKRGINHFAMRAHPDGDHNWYHEGDPAVVTTIRSESSREWSAAFVERISQDLEHRCLPFLVDIGGSPKPSQICLLRLCTHAILLLRSDQPDRVNHWERLIEESNLLPLARILSQRGGDSFVTSRSSVLEGTLTGLERHLPAVGSTTLFDELVERVAMLFSSYDLPAIRDKHLELAPTELVLNLAEALHAFTTTSISWEPWMLLPFLKSLPEQTPLSIYGVGPNWLYAALAAYADAKSFYLFDPKLPVGWVEPARVAVGTEVSAQMHVEVQHSEDMTVLTIMFPDNRLEYFQPDAFHFPQVPSERGLIINGRVPNWLLTALVRLYKDCGVSWIAPFHVQLNCAIIAYSCVEQYQPGDHVCKPIS